VGVMDEINEGDLAKIKELLWSGDVTNWKLAHQLLKGLSDDEHSILDFIRLQLWNYYWSYNRATAWMTRGLLDFSSRIEFEQSFNKL
jgi:hypothetical protein